MESKEIEDLILNGLKSINAKVGDEDNEGLIAKIAYDYNISYDHVWEIYDRIGKTLGVNLEYASAVSINSPVFRGLLGDYSVFRRAYSWEKNFCGVCIRILNELPPGGIGLYIGTPSSHSVCVKNPKWKDKTASDNLEVAIVLKTTTGYVLIVVGNLEDELKADVKVRLWKCFLPSINVIADVVDVDTYESYITSMAKSGELTKVVYMASGCWLGNRDGVYYDRFNFKRISHELARKFPNLIIIAMTRGHGKCYGFKPVIVSGKDHYNMIKNTFPKYLEN